MPFDAIVVPGGGACPGGEVPAWVENRLERAIELASPAAHIIALSAGTFYKPLPLDAAGTPVFEAVASASYLMRRGFDAGRILVENCSWDTIGNAYFCRVIHTDPRGFRRLAVITSEFHMPRTEAIFRWVFGLDDGGYDLAFMPVPDTGLSADALAARIEKERQGVAGLVPKVARIRSLAALNEWLYTEHRIYAPRLWQTDRPAVTAEILSSY